jgi:hypothetical protein
MQRCQKPGGIKKMKRREGKGAGRLETWTRSEEKSKEKEIRGRRVTR